MDLAPSNVRRTPSRLVISGLVAPAGTARPMREVARSRTLSGRTWPCSTCSSRASRIITTRSARSPALTRDLIQHECIRFRRPEKGDIYRWEFLENGSTLRIDPQGSITVNDGELMRSLAVKGLGLIYSSTFHTSRELAAGTLEPALLECSPSSDGLFLYFSKTARNQPKLRAFIDMCTSTLKL